MTWKEKLWLEVQAQYGVVQSDELFNQRQYEIKVHEKDAFEADKIFHGGMSKPVIDIDNQKGPFDAKNPFLAKIAEARNLSKGERICMHIEIDVDKSNMR